MGTALAPQRGFILAKPRPNDCRGFMSGMSGSVAVLFCESESDCQSLAAEAARLMDEMALPGLAE